LSKKISIPYGAIKSSKHNSAVGGYYISIPYGAIKRYISLALSQAKAIFQFLMVRLKGIVSYKVIDKKIISIPYGAIKSNILKDKIFDILDISIPYGAIKRINIPKSSIKNTSFQFLMVRLKAMYYYLADSSLFHFNSLWCD